jgi:hypothetical protein
VGFSGFKCCSDPNRAKKSILRAVIWGEFWFPKKQSNPRLIMNKKKHNEEIIGKSLLQGVCEKRKEEERRRQPSNGYARISIVGWICRRERLRRMRDSGRSSDNEI